MLVDSHCRLDCLNLAIHGGSPDTAPGVARAHGVGQLPCIGVSANNAQVVKALAERYVDVHCSVGMHPLDLEPGSVSVPDWLLGESAYPRVATIGETGLDYHYEPEAAELQREAFRLHLEAAWITAKPVTVHTYEMRADTLALLREVALPQADVLHCFTKDWETVRSALDLGLHISLSGIVAFRNADALHEVARQVPVDRLLVGTDSPYLAPIPHRGKPSLPEYVRDAAEFLTTLHGVSPETLAEQATANFHRLFPLARQVDKRIKKTRVLGDESGSRPLGVEQRYAFLGTFTDWVLGGRYHAPVPFSIGYVRGASRQGWRFFEQIRNTLAIPEYLGAYDLA